MKFYTSVSSSTRGQARRAQSLLSSPKSPVYIVRSDAEKGWERVAQGRRCVEIFQPDARPFP